MEARLPRPEDSFDTAREHLEQLIGKLTSNETLNMTHSDVEAFVAREGRETIRRLLQAHMDLRAASKPTSPVLGADGVERKHRRLSAVPLRTVVGEVSVTREAYSARDAGSLHPLDAALNLPAERYSFGLQKLAAIEASKGSFEEAVETVERATGTSVPKRQAELVTRQAAIDFRRVLRDPPRGRRHGGPIGGLR